MPPRTKKAKRAAKPARGAKNPQLAKARAALKSLRAAKKADKAASRAGLKAIRAGLKAIKLAARIAKRDAKAEIRLLTKQLKKALSVISRSTKIAHRGWCLLSTPIVAKAKKVRTTKAKPARARKAARGRKPVRQAALTPESVGANPAAVALLQKRAPKAPRAKRPVLIAPQKPTVADAAPAGAAPAAAVVPPTGNDAPVAADPVAQTA